MISSKRATIYLHNDTMKTREKDLKNESHIKQYKEDKMQSMINTVVDQI